MLNSYYKSNYRANSKISHRQPTEDSILWYKLINEYEYDQRNQWPFFETCPHSIDVFIINNGGLSHFHWNLGHFITNKEGKLHGESLDFW